MSHSGWSTSNYISAIAGTAPAAVPLTIHARYKPSAFSNTAYLVSVSDGSNNNAFNLRTTVTSGFAEAFTVFGGAGTPATGSTGLSAGTWYSLVGLFTSATDRKIYVDGAQDGTNATSRTPTGVNQARVGIRNTTNPALGSLAEVAIWNVALSTEDIAALVNVSPLLIRPDALVCYIPLLDSGTLDLVAPAATVTGSLTKDSDHPRVILPRQRSLIIPKGAGGAGSISGAATQTLTAYGQTATGVLAIKGNGTQTLGPYGQTATGGTGAAGSAVQTLSPYGQTAAGKAIISGQQTP